MRRRSFTRILLLGLVAVTILLVVRILRGPASDDTLVIFDGDFEVDRLEHEVLTVLNKPVAVELTATGSLQNDSLVAAYPWIIRKDDGSLIWSLVNDQFERGNGMTVSASELVTLEMGSYDLYFTSFGDPLQPKALPSTFFDKISAVIDDDFQRWRNEANRWNFSVKVVSHEDASLLKLGRDVDHEINEDLLIWTTGPIEDNMVSEHLFEIGHPVSIGIRCVGEYLDDFVDTGWVEDIETGAHVWDMETCESVMAGGSTRNRVCDESVSMATGRYRAVFRSNDRHSSGKWIANPPADPTAWGMRIMLHRRDDIDAVAAFDPWESLPRVASLTGIGNDQLVSYTFKLDKPTRVLIYALGEGYPKRGGMYDYAWIVGADDHDIWKMEGQQTKHAGGSWKNRRVETVLDLQSGVPYTVYYKTDGSHAYDTWNEDPPLHPDQWGVTIFALDPEFVPQIDAPKRPIAPLVSKPGYTRSDGVPLVSLQAIGNDMNVSDQFVLADSSAVHVYAIGEITRDGRYDWGWISNVESGAVVWEMRRENSVPAGGTSKNRLVDSVIYLPAGTYEVRYVTDDTHAFPDFRYGGAPDYPDGWGISVQLVEKGTK